MVKQVLVDPFYTALLSVGLYHMWPSQNFGTIWCWNATDGEATYISGVYSIVRFRSIRYGPVTVTRLVDSAFR
jgi:hypothetical protein